MTRTGLAARPRTTIYGRQNTLVLIGKCDLHRRGRIPSVRFVRVFMGDLAQR